MFCWNNNPPEEQASLKEDNTNAASSNLVFEIYGCQALVLSRNIMASITEYVILHAKTKHHVHADRSLS